jgi:hypothetical protein
VQGNGVGSWFLDFQGRVGSVRRYLGGRWWVVPEFSTTKAPRFRSSAVERSQVWNVEIVMVAAGRIGLAEFEDPSSWMVCAPTRVAAEAT